MFTPLRRITLFWLLLLLPTLAVGAGALVLLRREQARLNEQERGAVESRRAAIAARARLIVENVELVVGDVEAGLMAALNDAPVVDSDAYLDAWERNNPLVRSTFRLTPTNQVLRPAPRSTQAGAAVWLSTWLTGNQPWRGGSEEKKAIAEDFRRRKDGAANVSQMPSLRSDVQQWMQNSAIANGALLKKAANSASILATPPDAAEANSSNALQRKDVTGNVTNAQNLRNDIQQIARNGLSSNSGGPSSSVASTLNINGGQLTIVSSDAAGEANADGRTVPGQAGVPPPAIALSANSLLGGRPVADDSVAGWPTKYVGRGLTESLNFKTPLNEHSILGYRPGLDRSNPVQVDSKKTSTQMGPPATVPSTAAERNGWVPWNGRDGLHLIGWRQLAAGGVIGVEVNLATISARLGELLPSDGDMAEAFAVREAGGKPVQLKFYDSEIGSSYSARSRGPALPIVTVPISDSLLPGWEVVGFGPATVPGRSALGGFFLVGSLLVGTFVAAILAGGWLLLWQARRSEAEAIQKTSFVANVSHEFKTPLTTIRLYAELLEQGRVRDAAQGGDYLRTIGRETQRLARLVNNVLDFSRLEQGKKKFSRESLDLTAELDRLLTTHLPRIDEAGLTLRREFPAEALWITTDRDALEQIVLNLVDNACKYAGAGGEVTVALAPRENGGACIRVLDRGPGVPLEHRERIFEKFHRVDEALTAEKTGAGLGLSIARQLARGLGGGLCYVPRAGGGAEFIVELP